MCAVQHFFMDESGDHNLEQIDDEYPIFVLAGVLVTSQSHRRMEQELNRFKMKHLGNTAVPLHWADYWRSQNAFAFLQDEERRRNFYDDLDDLLGRLSYKIVACAIKKKKHKASYGPFAYNPYHYALRILIERVYYENRFVDGTCKIVAESRGDYDSALQQEYMRLCEQGTGHVDSYELRTTLEQEVTFRTKEDDVAALQIADALVSPIGRLLLGKEIPINKETIVGKFRRRRGDHWGAGLKVLP